MSLIAALTCPPNLRMWMWCKLAHFENLGQFSFEPLKMSLAVLWDMPDILTHGFSPVSNNSPEHEGRISSGDDVEITASIGNVNLNDESGDGNGVEERFIQVRGVFGLSLHRMNESGGRKIDSLKMSCD